MTKTAKPRRKTQSITIKDVPTEYIELFNKLAEKFPRASTPQWPRHLEQIYTSPKADYDMPRSELKMLFFCEAIHQIFNKEFGYEGCPDPAGERIKDHKEYRDVICNELAPK